MASVHDPCQRSLKQRERKPAIKAYFVTNYVLTRDAERDLINIYLDGLTKYGTDQTERYQLTLQDKVSVITDNPSFGADYDHIRPGLRRAECIAHSIYYRPEQDGILIFRFLYKNMDPARHI